MRRGPRLVGQWVPAFGSAVVCALGLAGCIIPDSGIVIEDEFSNPGAVRIVEPTPLTPRANEACDELPFLARCPNVPDTLPSGLIRPFSPLCVCGSGEDLVKLGSFEIFVEDPDRTEAGDPKDDIIGAFFLDMPANPDDPRDFLAYTNQLAPEEPARRYIASDVQTIERPDPTLKAWTISRQGRWDVCNDNDGADVGEGVHELRLIVTDRPWYRPRLFDAAGRPLLDEDGEPIFDDPVIGMPDIRDGATYATTTYVFECLNDSEVCSCGN